MQSYRIGILGEYTDSIPGHVTIGSSLRQSATTLGCTVDDHWIPTPELQRAEPMERLQGFDGVWASPGSPYASFEGMLRGIQIARESRIPFLGTCGGFQYALIEFARNVLRLPEADSAENNPGAQNAVITPVSCPVADRAETDPKLVGRNTLMLVEGSRLHEIFGRPTAQERYFCNFEVNPAFEPQFAGAGLRVAARGSQAEVRAVELDGHPFFFGSLFQPQLTATLEAPHPLITAFVMAAGTRHRLRARA